MPESYQKCIEFQEAHENSYRSVLYTVFRCTDRNVHLSKLQVKKCINALCAMQGSINPIAYVPICRIIPARRTFNVRFVINSSVCRTTWKSTWGFTVERRDSSVKYVNERLPIHRRCESIGSCIQPKRIFSAIFVRKHFRSRPAYNCISAYIQVIAVPIDLWIESKCLYVLGEKPHVCKICSKSFHESSSLSKHMNLHLPEKPFQCEICLKKFSQKYSLKKHLRTHEENRSIQCEFCPKTFMDSATLKKHQLTHLVGKEYSCDICPKKFTTQAGLKTHLTIHNGEKKFQCQECLKKFTLAGNLKTHIAKMHSIDRPRYECESCPKIFVSQEKLDAHEQSLHSTEKKLFPCEICHKTFTLLGNMKKHMKLHNVEIDVKPTIGDGVGELSTNLSANIMNITQVINIIPSTLYQQIDLNTVQYLR